MMGETVFRRALVVSLSVCALVATSAGAADAGPGGVAVLPSPSGALPVGTTTLHLIDGARPDPFQPDRSRELTFSVFYPATDVDRYLRAHYASTELIPGLEQKLGIELPGALVHARRGAPAQAAGTYPVVLYTPGGGVSRILGTGIAEDLASRGYAVVTVDHTYESGPAVEFPGGRIVRPAAAPNGFDTAIREKYVAARLLDFRFVLDSLAGLDANPSLDAFWQRATGWKRHLAIADSAHYDFTDMPSLVPAVARPAASTYIGAIDPDRMAMLVRGYVAAMFDKFLRGQADTVLDRPVTEPEVTTIR
ncbi:hypothetical protein [Nocardia sp. NPDC058480]|uniref:alpha/beta hydrolase n=1 Tax=Nocardia sp. NPDC058480 TaxID=3346522 RepID=UPI003666A48B